jgi:cobalt-zinc-cadmium efflux system protein
MSHHHHHHDHDHSHSHMPVLTNVNTAFIIGITLNLVFVIIEAAVGFYIHSLSLLGDAGHNLTDVGALAISLLAFKLMQKKPSKEYTYGYRKTSILAALLNAVLLLVTIGAIAYEAIRRLFHPEQVVGTDIAIVAGIGIVVNAGTAFLFMRNKEHDINVKGAYLHMMADAAVSLAIVVAGIIIHYTNWYWLDPAFSIIIVVVILVSTWSLLKDSVRLALDGVPSDIDVDTLQAAAEKTKGVVRIHHLHVWAMSTTQNALTMHVVVPNHLTMQEIQCIKEELKHTFLHHNIQHSTIETETDEVLCKEVEHC